MNEIKDRCPRCSGQTGRDKMLVGTMNGISMEYKPTGMAHCSDPECGWRGSITCLISKTQTPHPEMIVPPMAFKHEIMARQFLVFAERPTMSFQPGCIINIHEPDGSLTAQVKVTRVDPPSIPCGIPILDKWYKVHFEYIFGDPKKQI